MATVKRVKTPAEVVVVQEARDEVVLTLTPREAQLIRSLVGNTHGGTDEEKADIVSIRTPLDWAGFKADFRFGAAPRRADDYVRGFLQ